jgi:hypothetical protein
VYTAILREEKEISRPKAGTMANYTEEREEGK